jgi:hypothetical protein
MQPVFQPHCQVSFWAHQSRQFGGHLFRIFSSLVPVVGLLVRLVQLAGSVTTCTETCGDAVAAQIMP